MLFSFFKGIKIKITITKENKRKLLLNKFAFIIFIRIFEVQSIFNKMKTKETKSSTQDVNYTSLLNTVLPRQNGTSAGFAALQASLNRGKGLSK